MPSLYNVETGQYTDAFQQYLRDREARQSTAQPTEYDPVNNPIMESGIVGTPAAAAPATRTLGGKEMSELDYWKLLAGRVGLPTTGSAADIEARYRQWQGTPGETGKITYGGGTGPEFTMRRYIGTSDGSLRGLDPALTQNMRAELGNLSAADLQGALQNAEFRNQYGALTPERGPTTENPYGVNARYSGVDQSGMPLNWQGQYWGYVQDSPYGTYVPGWSRTAQLLGLPSAQPKNYNSVYDYFSGRETPYGGAGTPWAGADPGTNVMGISGWNPTGIDVSRRPDAMARASRQQMPPQQQPPQQQMPPSQQQPPQRGYGLPSNSMGKGGYAPGRTGGGKGGTQNYGHLGGMLGMNTMGGYTPWPQQYNPYSYRARMGGSSDPMPGSMPSPGSQPNLPPGGSYSEDGNWYQPPMPQAPPGMAVAQVMPNRIWVGSGPNPDGDMWGGGAGGWSNGSGAFGGQATPGKGGYRQPGYGGKGGMQNYGPFAGLAPSSAVNPVKPPPSNTTQPVIDSTTGPVQNNQLSSWNV